MTSEKLKKAIDLMKEINQLKRLLENAKEQKCEWIDFNHGDGLDSASVCNDKEIIEAVRGLIVEQNELKLVRLANEFDEL